MKSFRVFLLLFLLLPLMPLRAEAVTTPLLSPGLTHLAVDCTMIRSGIVSGEIGFSAEDFDRAVGCDVSSVTITALPPSSQGVLYYGSLPVFASQEIRASGLDDLRFVPAPGCKESSFRFKADGDYSMACYLRYTEQVNASPVAGDSAASIPVWTQQDITTFGTLSGSDPEGDSLTFEIVRGPENGLVRLLDASGGQYCYTPLNGILGEDSFTYTVRDYYGNYSGEVTVSVEVDKAAADLVFTDMQGHWAHNAALVMAAESAMDARSENGLLYFCPEEPMTREDFLVTVMKALGAGDIEPAVTVFADDSAISTEASGYVARAYQLGIIKGSEENGKLCFKPNEEITRAEGAVIVNAIVGLNVPDTLPVFADSHSLPAWASGSMYALSEAGIFKGTGSGNLAPNEVLSRAQTAEILLNVKKVFG